MSPLHLVYAIPMALVAIVLFTLLAVAAAICFVGLFVALILFGGIAAVAALFGAPAFAYIDKKYL
jgi:uncharacterized membrane protein YedE/YeeE